MALQRILAAAHYLVIHLFTQYLFHSTNHYLLYLMPTASSLTLKLKLAKLPFLPILIITMKFPIIYLLNIP